MTMKHLFQLSLLLLAFLLPATALAHDFEFDGIYYNIYDFDSNKVSVTYKGSASGYYDEYSGSVTIPSTFTCNGITFTVTSIGEHAFAGCSGLTSVTISNGVDSICDYAFLDCSSLTSITIPNSVTIIGEYAFYGTAWYNNQPDGVVYAGLVAYNYKGTMPSGTSIILRDGTIGIADWAFQQFTGLASVTIPNSVITIGDEAFLACSGLTSIDIPNSVTEIGEYAFSYCIGLTSITIGNSVAEIGEDAFSSCSGLTSILIPKSVTSIGYGAFRSCSGLTSLIVDGDNPTYDSRNSCNAIIETASNKLIAGCQNTTIPNTVTSIGDEAFTGCEGLTSIDIPNSVTTIGKSAFSRCPGLTSVTIGNSVTQIGNGAFTWCTGLTNIVIPSSVTSIGFEVFAQCPALTSISVASGNPIYDSRNNCNAIIETASNKLIAGCMNSVIPNTVTRIGNSAFQGCSGLTSITIPITVTSIGNWAFSECSGLTEIYSLALTPPTVYPYTFNGCYRATLYVPKQALNVYKTANYWKNFTNIIGVDDEPGDVDGDGSVTIADVTVLIDLLLGGDNINNEVADVNGDSVVSIKDVTDLIDMLLGS